MNGERFENLKKYVEVMTTIKLTEKQEEVAKEICKLLESLGVGGGKTVLVWALYKSDK